MAKLKKNAHSQKSAAGKPSPEALKAKAEQMSRSLVESAQQIWSAGVGAFSRAVTVATVTPAGPRSAASERPARRKSALRKFALRPIFLEYSF